MTVEKKGTCRSGTLRGVSRERNKYFTGKYMTARDFWADQKYFLERHWLHNRLTLGWGVACGLMVRPHRNPDCADRWVEISAGVAIDCCGREIILDECASFELKIVGHEGREDESPEESDESNDVREEQRKATYSDKEAQCEEPAPEVEEETRPDDERRRYLLCIKYGERGIEPVPALHTDCSCEESRTVDNRLCEVPQICLIPWTDDADETHETDEDERRDDDLLESSDHDHPGYTSPAPDHDHERRHPSDRHEDDDPCCDEEQWCNPCDLDCPYGNCVPLALVTAVIGPDGCILRYRLDSRIRRYVHLHGRHLTTIEQMNWTHGCLTVFEKMTAPTTLSHEDADLLHDCQNHPILWFRFSRPIRRKYPHCPSLECDNVAADDDRRDRHSLLSFGHGINRHTVRIEHHDQYQPPQALVPTKVLLCRDCRTVLVVLPHECRKYLLNDFVGVTVLCDFIEDCHGNPVDGTHLRGLLPTGDGVTGGTFHSWFRIVDSHRKSEGTA